MKYFVCGFIAATIVVGCAGINGHATKAMCPCFCEKSASSTLNENVSKTRTE